MSDINYMIILYRDIIYMNKKKNVLVQNKRLTKRIKKYRRYFEIISYDSSFKTHFWSVRANLEIEKRPRLRADGLIRLTTRTEIISCRVTHLH